MAKPRLQTPCAFLDIESRLNVSYGISFTMSGHFLLVLNLTKYAVSYFSTPAIVCVDEITNNDVKLTSLFAVNTATFIHC